MIRRYSIGDEKLMEMNEFSTCAGFKMPEDYAGWSVVVRDCVQIIAMWKEVSPAEYAAFILMDKRAGITAFREMKRLLVQLREEFNPNKIFTFSRDSDKLLHWHEFLGFKRSSEGGMVVDGKHLNKWVMTWDLKQ